MDNNNNKAAALIHKGDNTHIQLQLITLQSFNTIKTIVKAPANPMPPPPALGVLLLVIFVIIFIVLDK